jgi:opacity protein-like surface antigen
MKRFLMAALSATAICGFAVATPAIAQETVTGAPKGTAPATTEGYGPSSVVVCNEAGYCWHSAQRYDYPPDSNVVVHPRNWRWHEGERYAWREHPGRGYWHGDQWQGF